MTQRPDPPALRWLVGTELRNYRERAGLRQSDAGRLCGVTGQMVGHYENGLYSPHPEQLAKLLRGYEAAEWDIERLTSLLGRTEQRSWLARWSDVIPDWARTYIGLEGLAAHVVTYHPLVLPALVQTEAYSEGATEGHGRVRPDQAMRIANLRMERQRRLFADAEPLRLTAIIEESVLDRPIGGRKCIAAQLNHLITLVERDNVDVLVLPTKVGRHDGLEGRFDVLHFERAQSIGYIEFPDGAVYIQDSEQVAAYTRSAESLRAQALPQRESIWAMAARLDAFG